MNSQYYHIKYYHVKHNEKIESFKTLSVVPGMSDYFRF